MSARKFVDAEKVVKAALLGVVGFMMGLSLWIMEGGMQDRMLRVALYALVAYGFYRTTTAHLEKQDERALQITRMAGHLTRFCALLTVLTLWLITLPYDRPLRGWVWPTVMVLVLSWPDAFFRWYLGLRAETDGSLGARVWRVASTSALVAALLFFGSQVLVLKHVFESFGYGWTDLFFERVDQRWQPGGEREPEGARKRRGAGKSIYQMTDAELAERGIRRVPKEKKP